ncbi:unnamed protein product [Bursaphelenchus okinawaensis]|uniref:Fibronectin type-III domain-containing protein n=1 Tax=Bursaphelenchus okinawaensis TaxID=465554 RepID=A0A811KQR8_9BILA|nr:unnamed protein product [Bursaphelenchus okinawaensis]CAG9110813.1 unnamed protein product [Bursaphelenchus okinawaensis]
MEANEDITVDSPLAKWREVHVAAPPSPLPRHGHKAVAIREYMIVFGGGNEGIVNELYVFNANKNTWFKPVVRGEEMPGLAAFGMDSDGEKIYIFGGMINSKKYSDQFYELDSRRWEYRNLRIRAPRNNALPPCGRLGHSLNVDNERIAYIFGGMARDEDGSIRYLDDLYMVDMNPSKPLAYEKIEIGYGPCPRESHTSTLYETDKQKFLFIYGGMNGDRLGDIWILDLIHFAWREIQAVGQIPRPRSLHSASLVGDRIFVFGGWVPVTSDDFNQQSSSRPDWKCSNDVHSFNVLTNTWETFKEPVVDENNRQPLGRAGHSACVVNNRIYVWSGRDGIRNIGSNLMWCKDLYYLETQLPTVPRQILLNKATLTSIEITWPPVCNADLYHVELKKIGPDDQAQRRAMPQQNGQRIKRVHVPGASPPNLTPNPRPLPYRQITSDGRVFNRPGFRTAQPQQRETPPSGSYSNGHPTPEKQQYAPSYAPQTFSTPYQNPQNSVDAQMPSNILEDAEPEGPQAEKLEDPADISLSAESRPQALVDPANISLDNEPQQSSSQDMKMEGENEGMKVEDLGLKNEGEGVKNEGERLKTEAEGFKGASGDFKPAPEGFKDEKHFQNHSESLKNEPKPMEEGSEPISKPTNSQASDVSMRDETSQSKPQNPESEVTAMEGTTDSGVVEPRTTPEQTQSAGLNALQISSQKPTPSEWCYVGQVKNAICKITEYTINTPEGPKTAKMEAGFIYQFRVSASNACGQTPWSEPVSYKTGVPGFPGAPSSIKITKGDSCAHLSWEPPTVPNGTITEYSVYLAMKTNSLAGETNSFLKVYSGTEPMCRVDGANLKKAFVDSTPKPAFIFRIAARNEKGYGPATQVRWLQEGRLNPPMPIHAIKTPPAGFQRVAAPSSLPHPTYTKRVRIE